MTDFLVINKPKSKSEIRRHLKKQTLSFLARGGEVEIVPKGSSAHDIGEEPAWLKNRVFVDPATKRTPIPEVIKAMEERRLSMKNNKSIKKSYNTKSKQKIIYNDFGEPLRKIWIDE